MSSSSIVHLPSQMAQPRFPQPTPQGYQPSPFVTDVALPALLALVSFGVVSEVATPVVGSVVRLQAHYSPLVRGVKTAGTAYPTSILGTIKRVKMKEGWKGLHRGKLRPNILSGSSRVCCS